MAKNENMEVLKQISYKDAINKIIDEIIAIENGSIEIDEALKTKLIEIEKNIDEIETKIEQIDNGTHEVLEAAKSKLEEIEKRVGTNETNISCNTSSISTLSTKVNTNTNNITSLTSRVSTNETNISTNSTNISTLQASVNANTNNIATLNETVGDISESPYVWIQSVDTSINNTGMHNSIYVGKSLGTSFTSLQAESIAENSFEDMYIGDYWTLSTNINGSAKTINYRIGCFNYHQRTGDTGAEFTTSSVLLVPDTVLYTAPFNATNTTQGGYVGSAMYTEEECVVNNKSYYGLKYAREGISETFGDNLLTYQNYFTNAITNGYPSAGAWYDATIELMTEQMVYGSAIYACTSAFNGSSITLPNQVCADKSQLPLFAMNPRLINTRENYGLRNIVSGTTIASCSSHGAASCTLAADIAGVRPFFLVS